LLGHFALGEKIVLGYIREIENFPEDLEWKIRHLILSHHGKKEYGSPVEPQIPEAEILFRLDSLDATYMFQI
jgi:3'-5' exoribonuclease